jgi:hypothetical protein
MEETKFNRTQYLDGQATLNPAHKIKEQPLKDDTSVKDDLETSPTNINQPTCISTDLTKKSYMAKLKPIERSGFQQENRVLGMTLEPFFLLRFPIVVYAGFLYGSNIIWLSVLNATESMVLSARPYNMSTSMLGLTFIAPLVGTTLAYDQPNPISPQGLT